MKRLKDGASSRSERVLDAVHDIDHRFLSFDHLAGVVSEAVPDSCTGSLLLVSPGFFLRFPDFVRRGSLDWWFLVSPEKIAIAVYGQVVSDLSVPRGPVFARFKFRHALKRELRGFGIHPLRLTVSTENKLVCFYSEVVLRCNL